MKKRLGLISGIAGALCLLTIPVHATIWTGKDLKARITASDPAEQNNGIAYIWGVVDALNNIHQETTGFCFLVPQDTSFLKLYEVVRKYLEAHSSQLPYPAVNLISVALSDEWPCMK